MLQYGKQRLLFELQRYEDSKFFNLKINELGFSWKNEKGYTSHKHWSILPSGYVDNCRIFFPQNSRFEPFEYVELNFGLNYS
jgi:hypothetical protein